MKILRRPGDCPPDLPRGRPPQVFPSPNHNPSYAHDLNQLFIEVLYWGEGLWASHHPLPANTRKQWYSFAGSSRKEAAISKSIVKIFNPKIFIDAHARKIYVKVILQKKETQFSLSLSLPFPTIEVGPAEGRGISPNRKSVAEKWSYFQGPYTQWEIS